MPEWSSRGTRTAPVSCDCRPDASSEVVACGIRRRPAHHLRLGSICSARDHPPCLGRAGGCGGQISGCHATRGACTWCCMKRGRSARRNASRLAAAAGVGGPEPRWPASPSSMESPRKRRSASSGATTIDTRSKRRGRGVTSLDFPRDSRIGTRLPRHFSPQRSAGGPGATKRIRTLVRDTGNLHRSATHRSYSPRAS